VLFFFFKVFTRLAACFSASVLDLQWNPLSSKVLFSLGVAFSIMEEMDKANRVGLLGSLFFILLKDICY
jgi:flagellar biosynthesis protein FliR